MKGVTVRIAAFGSGDYAKALDLRLNVLRLPLGLTFTDADIAAERDEVCLAAFDASGAVVGSVNLVPHPRWAKLRQMAVAPGWQGQGIGAQLIEAAKQWASESGREEILLHARVTAVGFYEKFGWAAEGEAFTEVGIPHRRMRLAVTSPHP